MPELPPDLVEALARALARAVVKAIQRDEAARLAQNDEPVQSGKSATS
jgi:ABC-type nitrate/sulfonate/bicarbonate transport system substrate-binding protein